jgi:uncharacterized protein (TIGR03067 family)
MTRALLLGLFLVALCSGSLSFAEESPPNAPAAEALKQLQGKWNVTSLLKYGVELDQLVQLGIAFTFTDNNLKITGIGPQSINKIVDVNPEAMPRLLDFADSAEDLKARKGVWEGIYELDGDTLKWAIVLEGDMPAKATRAAAVESKVDSNVVLVTLKRAKE